MRNGPISRATIATIARLGPRPCASPGSGKPLYGLSGKGPFGRGNYVTGRSAKQRLDLIASKSCQAAAYGRQLKIDPGPLAGIGKEPVNGSLDLPKRQRAQVSPFCRDSVSAALRPLADAVNRASVAAGE